MRKFPKYIAKDTEDSVVYYTLDAENSRYYKIKHEIFVFYTPVSEWVTDEEKFKVNVNFKGFKNELKSKGFRLLNEVEKLLYETH